MNTGLQCTSLPLRFSGHAISSKADSKILWQLFLCISSLMSSIFFRQESPAYFSSNMNTGSDGNAGLSSHISSKGSVTLFTWIPLGEQAS